jgi:hypothetical protein
MCAPWRGASVDDPIHETTKGEWGMEIGKPQRKIVVEPVRDPVPAPPPKPDRDPARTPPPRKEPVRK